MPVYVDAIFDCIPTKRWPYRKTCHMIADTLDELEEMAVELGLAPHWIQHLGKPNEHYDLTPARRKMAVELGAIEITYREYGEKVAAKRKALRNGSQRTL